MKGVLMIATIFIFIKVSKQVGRVNEGASTSRDSEINSCEHCELENYANELVRLMFAEDRGAGNFSELLSNRFTELQAFHDEIFIYLTLAELGNRPSTGGLHRRLRLEAFIKYARKAVLKILEQARNEHYYHRWWYDFDSETNIISVHENLNLHSGVCLCGNDEERMFFNDSVSLPPAGQPNVVYQIDLHNDQLTSNEVVMTDVTVYHVIPLKLITRFFQVWLSDDLVDPLETEFNGCVATLTGRLKRSIMKLVLVRLIKTYDVNRGDWHDLSLSLVSDEYSLFYLEKFAAASNWLSGNMFMGPTNRGVFDPRYGKNETELLSAFDYKALPIIGIKRYKNLILLFYELRKFINEAPGQSQLSRLLRGFNVFVTMTVMLREDEILPLNIEQWIQREPTNDELSRSGLPPQRRRNVRTQAYWAIRIYSFRPPRALPKVKEDKNKRHNSPSLYNEIIKLRWSKFVEDVMTLSLEAHDKNQSLPWLCNFTRLYKDYLMNSVKLKNVGCLACSNFDEYLYSKISGSNSWQKCNDGSKSLVKWCLAWKRISLNSEIENKYSRDFRLKKKVDRDNEIAKPLSKSYLKDVKIFMDWLLAKTLVLDRCEAKPKKNKATRAVILSNYYPLMSTPKKTDNVFDYVTCNIVTFFSTLITLNRKNDCGKIFG